MSLRLLRKCSLTVWIFAAECGRTASCISKAGAVHRERHDVISDLSLAYGTLLDKKDVRNSFAT